LFKAETSYDNTSYKGPRFGHIFPDSSEVPDSVPTNCKNDMWTEINNICRLRSQNAASMKVQAGKK